MQGKAFSVRFSEQHQKLMDIYDCSYKSILPIYLDEGYYKIIAENFQGKKIKKTFTKSRYAMTLDVEFRATEYLRTRSYGGDMKVESKERVETKFIIQLPIKV